MAAKIGHFSDETRYFFMPFVSITLANILFRSPSRLLKLTAALGISAVLICLPAFAANNNLDLIKQFIQNGQFDQALKWVQQERQASPKDAQIQFLEAVILAQQGQLERAIDAFKKMTEAYPDLPEPYNNLGVLYASKDRFDEARAAFDKAILTHASYAAAHKNLSDVQAQMTRQSYARALQVDPKVKVATAQLTMLGAITTERSDVSKIPGPLTRTAPPAAITPPFTPAPSVDQGKLPEVTAKDIPVKPAKEATKEVAKPASKEATKEASKEAASSAEADLVKSAVQSWARSWSQKDMKKYFAAYASNFVPPDNMSRAKWESERELRITSKKKIQVAVSNFKIEVQGNQAKVNFSQVYESDNFKGNSRKSLELTKQNGIWLITRETVK
jgi:tetratricopeptide (TPR) repeat protein